MTFRLAYLYHIIYFTVLILLASLAVSVTQGTTITNWVGRSTHGLKDGSQAYPFDGSTQTKFDAVMAAVPENSTIIILPGTYQTKGTGNKIFNYLLKSGVQVYGSGIDVSIVKLATNTESGSYVMGFNCGTNELVQDITLDCNYSPSMGNVTLSGLCFNGTQCTARRVKVLNMIYNDTTVNSEAWGITLVPGNGYSTLQSTNNLYEQCIVSFYKADGGSGLAINGSSLPPNTFGSSASGIMRSNRIYNAYAAINGAWTHDWVIQGNYIQDGTAGLYGDTGSYTNVTLINNTFTNIRYPIFLATPPRNGLIVASNTIYLSSAGAALLCYPASPWLVPLYYYNFTVFSNTIARVDSSAHVFLNIYELNGLAVMNNLIDTNLAITLRVCSRVAICGNYDVVGNPYSSIDQGCTMLFPPGNFRIASSNMYTPY